jgi:hypothetical protein
MKNVATIVILSMQLFAVPPVSASEANPSSGPDAAAVVLDSFDPGWLLQITVRDPLFNFMSVDSLRVSVGANRSVTLLDWQPQDTTLTLTVHIDPAPSEDPDFALDLQYRSALAATAAIEDSTPIRFYLREIDGKLTIVTLLEQLRARTDPQTGRLFVNLSVIPPSDDARTAAPSDNPYIPAHHRRDIPEAGFEPTHATNNSGPDDLASTSSALSARTEIVVPSDENGCSSGTGNMLHLCLLTLLLAASMIARRHKYLFALLLSCLALTAQSTVGHAKVIYGYVSFWDTRTGMSDAPGSRFPTCIPTNTQCSPASGWSCCFRGLPTVRVEVWQGNVFLAADELTSIYGYFETPNFSGGNDALHYTIFIVFDRAGTPGSLRLTTNTNTSVVGSSAAPVVLQSQKLLLPGSSVNVGNLSINSAGDTNSITGDFGAAWTSAMMTSWMLELSNETLHRAQPGSPNSYDLALLRYGLKRDTRCAQQDAWISAGEARSFRPWRAIGEVTHGRIVGCNGVFPFFPTNPGQSVSPGGGASAEGIALGQGIGFFVSKFATWNPQTTSPSSVGLNCIPATSNKFNDVAWGTNNARALWELIDFDPTDTDEGFADTANVPIALVTEALFNLSILPPEAYFVQRLPIDTCTSQDECATANDVCILGPNVCYYGDPHGGNIHDLAVAVQTVANAYGITGQNFVNSMRSCPCVGPPKNFEPLNGGYHSD